MLWSSPASAKLAGGSLQATFSLFALQGALQKHSS